MSLHGSRNAAYQSLDYLLLTLDDLFVIELCAFNSHAEAFAFGCVSVVLCTVEKCLCGDASLIEANAAKACLLENCGLESAACRSFCRKVAAWAAADNYKLKLFHFTLPPCHLRSVAVNFSRFSQSSFAKRAAGAPSTDLWSYVRESPIAGYTSKPPAVFLTRSVIVHTPRIAT